MHYNFARIHQTLRVTPAMASGISDKLWSLEDICCDCGALGSGQSLLALRPSRVAGRQTKMFPWFPTTTTQTFPAAEFPNPIGLGFPLAIEVKRKDFVFWLLKRAVEFGRHGGPYAEASGNMYPGVALSPAVRRRRRRRPALPAPLRLRQPTMAGTADSEKLDIGHLTRRRGRRRRAAGYNLELQLVGAA